MRNSNQWRAEWRNQERCPIFLPLRSWPRLHEDTKLSERTASDRLTTNDEPVEAKPGTIQIRSNRARFSETSAFPRQSLLLGQILFRSYPVSLHTQYRQFPGNLIERSCIYAEALRGMPQRVLGQASYGKRASKTGCSLCLTMLPGT